MKLKSIVRLVLVGLCVSAGSAQAAQVVARCNYDFDVRPGVYDRGSVQLTKASTGYRLQFVQDDEMTNFDHVRPSQASGDQARDMIKKDASFNKYVVQARIYPEQITNLYAYVVPATGLIPGMGTPQARFFVFYGGNQRYLGGFGTLGDQPFVCDWAGQ